MRKEPIKESKEEKSNQLSCTSLCTSYLGEKVLLLISCIGFLLLLI